MKIITWNCNGAFRRKFSLLDEFNADIILIQECEDPERTIDENYRNWAKNYIWLGDNKNKGLGIFCRSSIELSRNDWSENNSRYFLSARISNRFDVVAVWNQNAKPRENRYIVQFWHYLQANRDKMNNCVIAGDFNSNRIWDKHPRLKNHTDVVNELAEIGVKSVYHEFFGSNQGMENDPTFFLHRHRNKAYHIDYIFANSLIVAETRSFVIGDSEKWLLHSDHLPLIADFGTVFNT